MASPDSFGMLTRRDLLKGSAMALGAAGLASLLPREAWAQAAGGVAAAAPNIIFILSDDVGIADISCYGGDHFATPNIDALAKTGTRFEYCYATPLCGPSRCQALTGRYPFRTGLNSNQSADAVSPEREIMLPTVMKQAGYTTACVGKWGQICLGPREWGFDEYLSFQGSGHYWASQGGGRYVADGKEKTLGEQEYLPDVMHRYLVDFIERHRDGRFYVHYAMSHIHGPILRTPDSKGEEHLYADNVAYMDKLVGELMAELDRLKLREKTLVIFAGDNGTARFGIEQASIRGRRVFGQKGQLNEGGCRVPLIANWRGTTPAGVNHDLTDFSDFFATFAELGGAALPKDRVIDGQSFAPQLKGATGTPRQWAYAELGGGSFAREACYKLTSSGELFDLRDAPFDEIAVPPEKMDAAASGARTRLEKVLKEHPAAPRQAGAGPRPVQRQERQQRRAARRGATQPVR